ncbi:MAG: patatin-like phospholipase family protein [Rubrivivax sp.]|nr:patatin-like phospholipase family protein [Rubrivivax sp.]
MQRRPLLLAPAAALAALGLPACSIGPEPDHTDPGAPLALPLKQPPRVAWVLSSGGPRGFVHVGVIAALAELGLKPDLIVGASAGALVGTLFAAGRSAADLERLALDMQAWRLARLQLTGGAERWSGRPLCDFINSEIDGRPLHALPLAMACVAQRLRDGSAVAFTHGNAGVAVQASAAIEGQFVPVSIRGERYADADLSTPLPVRVARALGARRVLAVDASAHEDRAPPGSERWREADLRKRELTVPDARSADLVLHPDTGYWAGMSREYRERLITIGRRDTLAQATALRALHAA